MNYQLDVLTDLFEIIKYNLDDYPVYANIGNLEYFYKYSVACHWHQDVEIGLLLKGDMDYFVNGEIINLKEGQCIFINSKRLHYNYSATQQNCRYLVVTINPSLFGPWQHAASSFIQSIFGASAADYLILDGCADWHQQIFKELFEINDELHSPTYNLLKASSYALSVCGTIADHICIPSQQLKDVQIDQHHQVEDQFSNDSSWLIAWKMTGFIHKNYSEKLTLSDIAAAGGVCRSTCCSLFSKHISQTPIGYLMNYRIQKSLDLLRESSCSISEIAMRCGFQSPSYFTQSFRDQTGTTPRNYRESHKHCNT